MGRGDHPVVVRHQRAPVEIRLELRRVRGRGEHEVELAGAQLRLERVVGAAQHVDLHRRLAGPEAGDRLRQDHALPGRARPDPDPAGDAGAQRRDLLARLLERGLQVAGVAEQAAAVDGERDAARLAVEQHHPDLVLQAPDRLGQRRLADAEPGRGAAHGATLGDREEVLDRPQVHCQR